ncbi:phage tail tube protein [Clostridium sp. HBUAS56010]|uniref:phage tail tube protein n=1 Tax=Clostridium sp. HBUAS56010 TaxID=2571127 RepID=UPI001177916C|nr:phage tail tube protein [Clostridium sp. HBUAS56010]DAJ05432.1 MAG TPA: tail tube protein [Caudoviricetes sp.]
MGFLLEGDALNGKAGRAFSVIDGRNVEMFGLKKMQADAEFQEADFNVVGTNLVQKKTKGVTLTGSFTIYYGTPDFLNMLKTYLKTGKLPYFTIQITNDDQGTTVGTQTVALYNVKLSKLPIAMLDDSADYLSMDVSFSFTNVEILNAFGAPAQLGE